MKNEIKKNNNEMFENIKHIDETGEEYWLARELQKLLEYREWRNFEVVINKAINACLLSRLNITDHFVETNKKVRTGDSYRKVIDYKLSRYACYLIAQNGDSRKKVIALAQTYFAIQTRKQELSEMDYSLLSEEDKRLYQRNLTRKGNYRLNQTAKRAGVKNFDKFHNSGYRGLYGGETADDIARRKGLRYREDILDNMCSDELIINLFRISQTNQKLIKDNITGENNANIVHYNMGKDIREFIKSKGGTLPEKFLTPRKSLKEIEKNKLLREEK